MGQRVAPVIPHPMLQTVSQLACVAACDALGLGQAGAGTPFHMGTVQQARLSAIRQPGSSVTRMMTAVTPHDPNARVAACLAGGGELDGVRIISQDGLNAALGAAEEAYDE